MSRKDRWVPMQKATGLAQITEAAIVEAMAITGRDRASVVADLEHEDRKCTYWLNDIYQVARRELHDAEGKVRAVHLNIRRRDGKPIFRDWRHFQWIKNELVGEECEGLELYPAESRLNDTSNKYHLWVFTDPTYRIPFGMDHRDVIEAEDSKRPGYRQRRM